MNPAHIDKLGLKKYVSTERTFIALMTIRPSLLFLPLLIACTPVPEPTPISITEWQSGEDEFYSTYAWEEMELPTIPNDTNWFWGKPSFMDEENAIYEYCWGEFGGGVIVRPLADDSLLYDVQNMNCPVSIQAFREGYLLSGYTGHGNGFSSILYLESLANINSFTKLDFLDTLPVVNQAWQVYNDTTTSRYDSFNRWKLSQAQWLMDTMSIQIVSVFPRNENELTVIYGTFHDTTGLFAGQFLVDEGKMSYLHQVQLITPDFSFFQNVYSRPCTLNGDTISLTTFETSPRMGPVESLELINFGDSVVWRRK